MKTFLLLCLVMLPFYSFAQDYRPEVLSKIISRAQETHSDALLIYQHGSLIHADFFGKNEKPVYIASAGKSLVSMAIGRLLDQGQIDSLDQPVSAFFPEWKQGKKKDITIRMLLNHTSGLQDLPNASVELEPAPDWQVENVVRLALAAELQSDPGQHIFYSNKAVALLGGIIEKASGKRMDEFFIDQFFDPMGISDYDWIRDKAGNPTAHGAFVLKPSDFLKFGILMLQKGTYDGVQLLSDSWIDLSTQQTGSSLDPIWGLLWWRLLPWEKRVIDQEIIDEWVRAGADLAFVRQLVQLKNKVFESPKAFSQALEQLLGKDWRTKMKGEIPHYLRYSKRLVPDEQVGYYANGFRGNFLVVIPEYQLVAVRCADPVDFNYATDTFGDFVHLLSQLGR